MDTDPQYSQVISTIMAANADIQSASLLNIGQPEWLNFSDKISTRKDLFSNLDRLNINQTFDKNAKDPKAVLLDMMALKIQNDFIGAIARDVMNWRRGRLDRIGCHVAIADGRSGVLNDVVLGSVQTLLSAKR
jgi:hypothetical protein